MIYKVGLVGELNNFDYSRFLNSQNERINMSLTSVLFSVDKIKIKIKWNMDHVCSKAAPGGSSRFWTNNISVSRDKWLTTRPTGLDRKKHLLIRNISR